MAKPTASTAIVLLGLLCAVAGRSGAAGSGPNEADLNSTLSQHAARTTTISEEFHYELKQPAGLTIMYNGHRGSKIEPCGCRALNLGGIDKEAAMVHEIRRQNPAALLLDTGGFFREFTDPSMRLQTWYLMDAMAPLGVQAMNVGFPDLNQGMASLQEFEKRFKLPFISANIINTQTGEPVFAPFKSLEVPTAGGAPVRVAIVGVTAPNRDVSRGGPSGDGATTAGQSASAAGGRARWMIAETNGLLPGIAAAAATHGFSHELTWSDAPLTDLAGGGGAAPVPSSPGGSDPAIEFAVKGADAFSSAGVAAYRVDDPLAPARDAAARLRPNHDYLVLLGFVSYDTAVKMAPQLGDYDVIIAADYVDHTEPSRPVADGPLVIGGDYDGKYLGLIEAGIIDGKPGPAQPDRLPVLQSIKPAPEFTRYLDEFARHTAMLPVEQSPSISEKIYAGATSCRTCHADAYNQWKTHHHSRAMKALVDKNMHFNPDCLRCHTVAYRQPGGFVDLRVSANLANVQCEVCHGPGEAHVQEMRAAEALKREGKPAPAAQAPMRMTWDQNFCMQCHDPANDPHFNFVQDIQRVRHKNPAAPRERPTTASLMM